MTKALMVAVQASAGNYGTGDETNLIGFNAITTTEANAQASCTENATFSNLRARIISGGSGTNNFQFRDAGANGNQLATRAGTGDCEDTDNTDTLTGGAPGDLFNIAYTDTGTASVLSWLACNIELESGYGAIHGSASFTGTVHDVASSTRFLALAGPLVGDGSATEAGFAWKARGYTTFEALQIRISANARTNDSTVRNRINSGNGSAAITIGAGTNGLFSATGLADAIGDGQIIDASLTLGTGVEDLTITFCAATLKSTNTKQDVWFQTSDSGLARAASATEHYFTPGGFVNSLTAYTEAQARVKPGFAGTASNWRVYLSANTYGANATMTVYLNGVSAGTLALTAGGGAGWYEDTSNSFSFDDNDEISLGFKDGTSGSATLIMGGLTLAPTVSSAVTGPLIGGFHLLTNGPLISGRLIQ